MRKLDTATANKRLLKLFWKLALWFCILLPIVNGLGLNAVINAINDYLSAHPRLTYGSRLFWELCVAILNPIVSFARVFFHFFGYGLFTLALYRFGWKSRHTWAFFGMATLCILMYPLCGFPIALSFAQRITSYELLYVLLNVLFVFAVELGILLLITLCNWCFVRTVRPIGFEPVGETLNPRRHPLLLHFFVLTLLHSGARLIYTIVETVSLVDAAGAPESFGDWLSLSEPYLSLVLCSLLGYYTLALLTAAAESKVGYLCPPANADAPAPVAKKKSATEPTKTKTETEPATEPTKAKTETEPPTESAEAKAKTETEPATESAEADAESTDTNQ